jgi:hypothetical protein
MRAEDLYRSMNGIDDNIIMKCSIRSARTGKRVHIPRTLLAAACILFIAASAVTVNAAIRHFWGRGMAGLLMGNEAQQQELTEQGQAIVYPEEKEEPLPSVTHDGITITPDTIIADSRMLYISMKVSGFDYKAPYEPGFSNVNVSFGDNPDSQDSWIDLYGGSFFDGILAGNDGGCVYEDGRPCELDSDGNLITYYTDENGDLEYIMECGAMWQNKSLLGQTIHVSLKDLGYFYEKCNLTVTNEGDWSFDLKVPSTDNSQTIQLNKQVGDTGFTIDTVDISPVSIKVNYSVNGQVKVHEDNNEIPFFQGVIYKDGTKYKYLADCGGDGFDETDPHKAYCYRGFSRVIDISQVRTLIFNIFSEDGESQECEVELQ